MSTKHVRTISDLLRFRLSLTIECHHCRRKIKWSSRECAAYLGKAELKGLSRRLRCVGCGFKQATITFLD